MEILFSREANNLSYTNLSKTFDTEQSRKIGLQLAIEHLAPDLKIGTMQCSFHSLRIFPELRERLNS